MNIIRPADTSTKSQLPVMVWIYGGAFLGMSTCYTYSLLHIQVVICRGRERTQQRERNRWRERR